MCLKILVATLFVLMLLGAFLFEPAQLGKALGDSGQSGVPEERNRRFRLMTWNIGNGDLESETRAHVEDLAAVAQVILSNDAEAVALQELTGEDQLKLLLTHLKNRYRGYVCAAGSADRVAAVLVRDRNGKDLAPRFESVPAGDKFAAAATFHLSKQLPEIVLISAHADAFNASRRRVFLADLVDWARVRTIATTDGETNGPTKIAFIAGDLNFEVSMRNRSNLFTNDAKHDSESYAYLLKYFRDLGLDAGETSVNDRRIDYVFGPLRTAPPPRAEVVRGADIGRMDHLPLLVEVTF